MEKELQIVLAYLDKIAEKLNIGIDQVWPWFIRQQYIDAMVSCISFVIIFCLFSVSMYLSAKYWRKDWIRYDKEGNIVKGYSIYHSVYEGLYIIFNGVLAIFLVLAAICFFCEFFDIFNANYWAFIDILDTIKPQKIYYN